MHQEHLLHMHLLLLMICPIDYLQYFVLQLVGPVIHTLIKSVYKVFHRYTVQAVIHPENVVHILMLFDKLSIYREDFIEPVIYINSLSYYFILISS